MIEVTCKVEECSRGGKMRRGMCEMHWTRWRKHGDTETVLKGGGSRGQGPEHASWSERPGYDAAHLRVRKARGRAAEMVCACGGQAAHWAYTHDDPDELIDPRGRAYSGDVARYVAMCVPCHKRFDLSLRAA